MKAARRTHTGARYVIDNVSISATWGCTADPLCDTAKRLKKSGRRGAVLLMDGRFYYDWS
jgi:hypothetical protein